MLSLVVGFLPGASDIFTFLDAGSLLGDFDNILSGGRLDTLDGSGSFLVNYGSSSEFDPSQIVLSDFQSLISSDPLLADWQANYGSQDGGLGDFDGDFDVDGADFLVWQRGGASNLSSSQIVPEPTSLALLAISLLLGQTVVRHSRHNDCV